MKGQIQNLFSSLTLSLTLYCIAHSKQQVSIIDNFDATIDSSAPCGKSSIQYYSSEHSFSGISILESLVMFRGAERGEINSISFIHPSKYQKVMHI